MKRTIAVILAAILCLSLLAACGGGGGGGSNTQAEKKSVVLLGSNYGDKSFFDSARTGVPSFCSAPIMATSHSLTPPEPA